MVAAVVLCAVALLVRRVWPWAALIVVTVVTTAYVAAGCSSHAIIGMVSGAMFPHIGLVWVDGGYVNVVDSGLIGWAAATEDPQIVAVPRNVDVKRLPSTAPRVGGGADVSLLRSAAISGTRLGSNGVGGRIAASDVWLLSAYPGLCFNSGQAACTLELCRPRRRRTEVRSDRLGVAAALIDEQHGCRCRPASRPWPGRSRRAKEVDMNLIRRCLRGRPAGGDACLAVVRLVPSVMGGWALSAPG